jgi:hypothetical protein
MVTNAAVVPLPRLQLTHQVHDNGLGDLEGLRAGRNLDLVKADTSMARKKRSRRRFDGA